MTAKEFVKSKIPNAIAEKHYKSLIINTKEVYWLIRDGRNTMYIASGKSESNAWVEAKKRIIENDLLTNKTNNK